MWRGWPPVCFPKGPNTEIITDVPQTGTMTSYSNTRYYVFGYFGFFGVVPADLRDCFGNV